MQAKKNKTKAKKRCLPAAKFRLHLSDHIDSVLRGERVVIARHGSRKAALVSCEDLELLEALEDLVDVQEIRARIEAGDLNTARPARDVFKDLGWD